MLKIIQTVAILQGIFLAIALLRRREVYKTPVFELFIGCILSVVLFTFGDDNYNLLVEDAEWFFFHEPLIITFFFLFIRYSNSELNRFRAIDFIFFLPYITYLLLESFARLDFIEYAEPAFIDELIEFPFLLMLLYSIYEVIVYKKNKWFLVFLIPFALIFAIDNVASLFTNSNQSIFNIDSYGIFMIAIFLFYSVTYKLISNPKQILPKTKYKTSTLTSSKAEDIQKEITRLMVEEKVFRNQKLSANDVAHLLGITRQQLSEVVNVHLGMRFQDVLNQYRVEEFIACLNDEKYKDYTILGIATEAGFSSKSSFNAIFKKIKGVTPSQYKKQNVV